MHRPHSTPTIADRATSRPRPACGRRVVAVVVAATMSLVGCGDPSEPTQGVARSADVPTSISTVAGRVTTASGGARVAMRSGLLSVSGSTAMAVGTVRAGSLAPTTTPPAPTTPPPPPTTAPPAPPPPTEPAPTTVDTSLPLDQATAHLDPGGADPAERAAAALRTAVPARWLAVVPVDLRMRPGHTSLSHTGGVIEVGTGQMDLWHHALYVVAHEWAHQAAFRVGTGASLGAPPAGFPATSSQLRAEQFAECVAQALVGYRWPNPYPHCPDSALTWTRNWLAAGPG